MTPIDTSYAAMQSAPDDDTARLRFYERFADGELFLLLDGEAVGDQVSPRLFDTGEGQFVLVFDTEDRLAQFAGGPAPYAAVSGRSLAVMLSGQGIGIGLNLDVAPSAILIPSAALSWLQETLGTSPQETSATAEVFTPPSGLPDRLIEGLDAKLASAQGLAKTAYLTGVTYRDGRRGHLLALIDPAPGAETALAQAVSEALVFSGLDAGELDVTFFAAGDPATERLEKTGLRFDLPEVQKQATKAPGMDPNAPPRLR